MDDEWAELERDAFSPGELDELAEHLRSAAAMDDQELLEWLLVHVLGYTKAPTPYSVVAGTFWCDPQGFARVGPGYEDFAPLASLDDARLLEDRLRKLGLARDYAENLFALLLRSAGGFAVGACDYLYATPRQRCEAIKLTWEQYQKGTES